MLQWDVLGIILVLFGCSKFCNFKVTNLKQARLIETEMSVSADIKCSKNKNEN